MKAGPWLPRVVLVVGLMPLLCAGSVARAQGSTNVGKPMPELKVREWISAEKVTPAELEGKPYVVEFWATWCPPCRTSTPHLVKLAKKLEPRGLTIIGISRDRGGSAGKVKAFYKKYKMNYPVAIDGGMGAKLRFQGIPHAFVVDQTGVIAWEGHPMSPMFEKAIGKALDEWVIRLADFPTLKPLAIAILRKGGRGPMGSLLKLAADPKKGAEAKKLLAGVRKLARAQLAGAMKRAEEMPTEAVKAMDAVARKYEGLAEAAQAAARARAIRSDPGFADEAAVVKAATEIEEAHQKKLMSAISGIRDRMKVYKLALPIFEHTEGKLKALVKKYPKAKATKRARRKLGEVSMVLQRLRKELGQAAKK